MAKCKGTLKIKNKDGKVIKKLCNYELSEYDIFCPKCGEPTNALSTKLSAKQSIQEIWKVYTKTKNKYIPFSLVMIFLAFFPVLLAYIFKEDFARLIHLNNYFSENILYLFTIPLSLIPFASQEDFLKNPLTPASFFSNLKHYFSMLIFVFLNIFYFFLLKVICAGYLLNILVDPILHIVRFILVIYWLVIVIPAPLLIIRRKLNPIKAIILSYKASAETRWQQFFILLYLFILNILGGLLFLVGLLYTIPLIYILIEKYYFRLQEYQLFEEKSAE